MLYKGSVILCFIHFQLLFRCIEDKVQVVSVKIVGVLVCTTLKYSESLNENTKKKYLISVFLFCRGGGK